MPRGYIYIPTRARVRPKIELPPIARAFLRTSVTPNTKRTVYRFHCWLLEKKLNLMDLQPSHIDQFLNQPVKKKIAPVTRRRYRSSVLPYLDRLYDKKKISFDPSQFPRHLKPIPAIAAAFVETLKPTLTKATCEHYVYALRSFHKSLDDNRVTLSALKRKHLVSWFQALNEKGLSAITRCTMIICTRVYLRWLEEQKLISVHADDLIRPTDQPKLPLYLPRPFPPEVDCKMQERLEKSCCQYQLGLLLMRRTGLRIGELISLERNCVRTDLKNNKFLKVPLGKLKNERLVPIDEKTERILERIQRIGQDNKQWLLEKEGKKTRQKYYRKALHQACSGLEIEGPVHSHRLRHTYATSLLNAGMSIVALMKLLGHRDHHMTLRYAAITQETVKQEYAKAIVNIEKKYATVRYPKSKDLDPVKIISDLNRWIHKHAAQDSPAEIRRVSSLKKRLGRLKTDIQSIVAQK